MTLKIWRWNFCIFSPIIAYKKKEMPAHLPRGRYHARFLLSTRNEKNLAFLG